MSIRYESMRIDKLLLKEYIKEIFFTLNKIEGLTDIHKILNEFESSFANYIGTKYAIAVNSGTDALQLILTVLNIGKGDTVIVPNVSYPAVPLAVKYVGAEPIFVEIKEDDLTIDEKEVVASIRSNTKAIIAVHMFSHPCELDTLCKIAKERNIYLIEDVCQAESSTYKGKKLGSFGELAAFSFSYYKPLSSCGGGGGMITFNDPRYKKILNYTQIWKDDDSLLKLNKKFARMYLLDLIAVKTKFKHLHKIIESREKIKKLYEKELGKIKQIKIFRDRPCTNSVLQNYVIFAERRDELKAYLKKKGIRLQEIYTPFHLMKVFNKNINRKFPISEKYYKYALLLPLFSFMREEECFHIINLIKDFYSG